MVKHHTGLKAHAIINYHLTWITLTITSDTENMIIFCANKNTEQQTSNKFEFVLPNVRKCDKVINHSPIIFSLDVCSIMNYR